jgi:pyruvate kinase
VGDELRFKDTRGRKRKFIVSEKDSKGLILESHKRAYIATGTKLRLIRKESGEKIKFRVGKLPPIELPIILRVGDTLILERGNTPGEPAHVDRDGLVLKPAHVTCKPSEIFQQVSVGAPVRLNDGKIEAIVRTVSPGTLEIEITRAKASGSRLRSNRSINFPGSDLRFQGLTDEDRENLAFIVEYADAVCLSFVRKPDDIIALQQELRKYPDRQLGIIPKIETKQAFKDLPRILLAAMRAYPAGVMIARGDLAVEAGWERLAELQEEILWMCEAAQLPVIWATQVLEGAAKKGRPTRAEITDAAMSQRADCVMLNKGPHILGAIKMLDNILRRMQGHQYKKTARLRKLSVTEL